MEEREKFLHDTIAAQRTDGLKKVAKENSKKRRPVKVPAYGRCDRAGVTRMRGKEVSSLDGGLFVIYRANGNFRAFNYLLEVLHIFDRQDLFHLYELVTKQYLEVTMEGIELILWEDLKIMMESLKEENDQSDFWNNQQN
ncbi:hypothetical protein Tco_0561459 [Tanacetum coccineum]